MKKVMVVSYCTWTSLGSILQAMGLKQALLSLGYKSEIILDHKFKQYSNNRITNVKSLVAFVYRLIHQKDIKESYRKRNDFINNHMDTLYFGNYDELSNEPFLDSSCVYLAGSDQIWNPDQCNPVFFLDFAKDNKIISYAASMGKTEISAENKDRFMMLLSNFDEISVREQECADVIHDLLGKNVVVNIDPTFLISSQEWRSYEEPYNIKKPYILLYMLYWDMDYKQQIIDLKKRTGLPVYAISNGLSRVYADKYLLNVGPSEFLWLIDHAEYVITSSFHGVAFSTIFNKKFSAIINPALPSRISHLLQLLSIPEISISKLDKEGNFNYPVINNRIIDERKNGMQYLQRVLQE